MPGGRLTRQERLRIAEGLAQDLSYAEIGRALARPTSTITREVHRNGGPRAYRPDPSQRATVRRRKPPEADPPREVQAMRAAETRLVAMAVQTGLPPMMAKVLFALLVSETGAMTAAELAQHLQVSPASVSRAVQSLEHLEFVSRERDSQPRRERYVLQDHTWPRVWASQTASVQRWADEVAHSSVAFGGTGTPAGTRLAAVGRFLELIHAHMLEVTDRWERLMDKPD